MNERPLLYRGLCLLTQAAIEKGPLTRRLNEGPLSRSRRDAANVRMWGRVAAIDRVRISRARHLNAVRQEANLPLAPVPAAVGSGPSPRRRTAIPTSVAAVLQPRHTRIRPAGRV